MPLIQRHAVMVVMISLALSICGFASQKRNALAAEASARNLRQWGIALQTFLADNGRQLPETGATPVSPDQIKAWYNALPPYLNNVPLASLPPGSRPRSGDSSLWIDASLKSPRCWDGNTFYFNYAMNRFLQPEENKRSFRTDELDHPRNVLFLIEVDGYEPACAPDTVAFRRHAGGPAANVLFCDGHVETISKKVLTEDPASRMTATAAHGPSWFAE